MEIKINKVQLALYSPGVDLSDKLTLTGNIRKGSGNLFSGEPLILPVPDNVPNEIPRIILKDKKGGINLHISVNKIDLHIRDSILAGSVPSVYSKLDKSLLEVYRSVLNALLSATSLTINRVGFVVVGEVEIKDASAYITDKYLTKDIKITSWLDVNVSLLKREAIDKKESNVWLRLSLGRKESGEVDNNKLIVIFDINTLSKKNYSFTVKDLLSYVKQSSSYLANYSKEILL